MIKTALIIVFVFLLNALSASAQVDTIRLKQAETPKVVVTDRPPQAAYFQFGGSGPIFSVNYDRRFRNRVNGAGFAVGLGFYGETGLSIFSIPVSLNYLIGRLDHFIEIAGGTTFVTAQGSLFNSSTSGSGFIHHANLGYRYQRATGGFFLRGGISPLFVFSSGGGYATSYYIGFGKNF
jgi:hypothetical protein